MILHFIMLCFFLCFKHHFICVDIAETQRTPKINSYKLVVRKNLRAKILKSYL